MKKLLFIFVLLSCFSCESKREVSRDLYIADANWDFGTIESNAKLEHIFSLENRSNDTCVIKNIITSCGCTEYSLEKRILPPQEKCKLKIVLEAPSSIGYFTRDITVFTSLNKTPVTITLSAYIPVSKEFVKRNYTVKLNEDLYANIRQVCAGNLFANIQIANRIELVNISERTLHVEYALYPQHEWADVVGIQNLEPWKPEQITILCNGEKMGKAWGKQDLCLLIEGNNEISKIPYSVNLIPYNLPKIERKKGPRIFLPNSKVRIFQNEQLVEIRNLGLGNLKVLKIKSLHNSNVCISDSLILSKKNSNLKIKLKSDVEKDTVQILTNDIMSPISQIILHR